MKIRDRIRELRRVKSVTAADLHKAIVSFERKPREITMSPAEGCRRLPRHVRVRAELTVIRGAEKLALQIIPEESRPKPGP